MEAWGEIKRLGGAFSTRGLYGSGIERETFDNYIRQIRRSDEQNRKNMLTEEESQRREQLIKYASPEEIAALSDEEKEKYGFKPSDEVMNFFSSKNLKSIYPNLSDEEIENYRNSIIDSNGNYRSDLYQKAYDKQFESNTEQLLQSTNTIPCGAFFETLQNSTLDKLTR